ncbi:MAG: hypothetical protein J5906_04110 [Acidaminococcaceae bacterium]|nr:hypothetical protein [Acidaminococcaceae bacterium]
MSLYYDAQAKKYADLTVKADMSETCNLFHCLECWVAEDALSSGREQKWLNVMWRKR